MATPLQASGRSGVAEPIAASSLNSDVVTQVKSLNQQAVALMRRNELDHAEELLAKAQSALAAPGVIRDDPAIIAAKVTTLNNQGCNAKRRGANLKAVSCFETAMSLERHITGTVTSTTLINLSTALTAMGEVERACVVAADALASIPKTDSNLRLVAMHNLAVAKYCAGDKQHALSVINKALKAAVTNLGEGHATTQSIRKRVAEWTPGVHNVQEGMVSRGGLIPAPPLTARQAAARALRSLDFGTPEPSEAPATRSGLNTVSSRAPGGFDTPLPVVPDSALPGRDSVMAGATFGSPNPAGDSKALPPLPQQPTSTSITTPLPQSARDDANSALPPVHGRQSIVLTNESGTPQSLSQQRKKKGSEPRAEPHGFCRFAIDEIARPPPPKIAFSDVRRELRILKASDRNVADEQQVTRSYVKDANPFLKRATATSHRKEQEDMEDRAFLARCQRLNEIEQREQERQHRAKLVALSRRTHAARIIQQTYRRWRATNKAMLDAKRQTEQRDNVNRAKTVVNFANKWLNRTAGKRLVARMNTQANFQLIEDAVVKVQRAWKAFRARLMRHARASAKQQFKVMIQPPERRAYAAIVIQTWFRQLRAKAALKSLRVTKYVEHCILIQRWIRTVFRKRRAIMSENIQARRREWAAVRVQTMWRGAAARFHVSMMRFQRRVRNLRSHEARAVMTMQRVLRGYGGRKRTAAVKRRLMLKREADLAYRPDEPTTTVGLRIAAPSRHPTTSLPPPMSTQQALREHEKRRALEVELAVEPQREHVQARFDPGLSRRQVELQRAAESLTRHQELQTMKRLRATITIQRTLRRYFKSQTFQERQRYIARRSVTTAAEVDRNVALARETFERDRRRQANDLAKDVREQRLTLQHELSEIDAPLEFAEKARTVEERQAAAARLREMELALAAQLEREREAMRLYEVAQRPAVKKAAVVRQSLEEERAASEVQYGTGSGAYLTLRQRRALLQQKQADPTTAPAGALPQPPTSVS